MPIKKEFVKVLKFVEDAASSKLVTNHKQRGGMALGCLHL